VPRTARLRRRPSAGPESPASRDARRAVGCRLVHGDVQAGAAHRLLRGRQAPGVVEFGEDRRRDEWADAVVARGRTHDPATATAYWPVRVLLPSAKPLGTRSDASTQSQPKSPQIPGIDRRRLPRRQRAPCRDFGLLETFVQSPENRGVPGSSPGLAINERPAKWRFL
jgi:hypothetical protein